MSGRVLLAEADTPTRMGLRVALAAGGFDIVGEARDAATAVACVHRHRPDAALVATDLPGDGLLAVRAIAAIARVVALTPAENADELLAAVLAGASGYVGKDISQARLPRVIAAVLAGESALPRRYTSDLLEALQGRDVRRSRVLGRVGHEVTERQWEILQLLAEGRTTAEIARRLGISEVTARRHISSVLPKLGLKHRKDAVELMLGRSRQ